MPSSPAQASRSPKRLTASTPPGRSAARISLHTRRNDSGDWYGNEYPAWIRSAGGSVVSSA